MEQRIFARVLTLGDFINQIEKVCPKLAKELDGPDGPHLWHLGRQRAAYSRNLIPCAGKMLAVAKEIAAGETSLELGTLIVRSTIIQGSGR